MQKYQSEATVQTTKKNIVLVTGGLMEFGQFVRQLRLNLVMDLMRGGVETKLVYVQT